MPAGGGKEGSENGEEHQHQNDNATHNRALVLAEATECALEIAYRLGIELTVVVYIISCRKLEFFRGDIIYILHIHNYLAPILILGSMKP